VCRHPVSAASPATARVFCEGDCRSANRQRNPASVGGPSRLFRNQFRLLRSEAVISSAIHYLGGRSGGKLPVDRNQMLDFIRDSLRLRKSGNCSRMMAGRSRSAFLARPQ
jgi:hypothetical protein